MTHKSNFFVLTGGPGVGKTAVIDHLRATGELTVAENARAVIRDELEARGRGVPWLDNARFVSLTTERDIADFDARSDEDRRVFFDRGIMDMYGANGSTPSPRLVEVIGARRYNRRIFVFPPWREIYATDAERRQDWDEAERTFARVLGTMPELGYEPLIVPKASIETRATFVLAHAVC